ncbi:hypothetical protein BDZ89DRAFT_1147678 [Hymenopellis radicata]|nr:hypothetical protein BDZ89DRAFT_1147678 [Hymenopellis radicata]
MLSYSDALPPKRHAYLAKKQGTRFPVITIVGAAERRLYSNLMRDDRSFAGPNGPVWGDAVKRWNREANGETIFYKLIEHLQKSHKKWLQNANIKHTKMITHNARKAVDDLVRSQDARTEKAPPVPQISMPSYTAPTAGENEQDNEDNTTSHVIFPSQIPSESNEDEVSAAAGQKRKRAQSTRSRKRMEVPTVQQLSSQTRRAIKTELESEVDGRVANAVEDKNVKGVGAGETALARVATAAKQEKYSTTISISYSNISLFGMSSHTEHICPPVYLSDSGSRGAAHSKVEIQKRRMGFKDSSSLSPSYISCEQTGVAQTWCQDQAIEETER